MKFCHITLLAATIAAPWLSAHADHPAGQMNIVLPEVSVSETRDPLGPSLTQPDIERARIEINHTPGGVAIIDAEQVREGRVSTFADTLGMTAGVLAQSRFGAEEARLSIRGSGLQRTFHGRGIKLMQDGIPVNLADGSFDFQTIDPLATRYIEVYRGANALRYGAGNLGGAVNFVSATGYDTPRFETRGELGSFDYQRLGIRGGGVNGNFDYFVSGSTFGQNGFRENAEQSAEKYNANIGYRFHDDLETRFFIGYVDSKSELPGNLTKAQLRDDPSQSILSPVLGQQRRDVEVARISNKTTLRFGDTRLELGAFYSDRSMFHPIFQVLDQDNKDYGVEARLTHHGKLFGLHNEFVLGMIPSYGVIDEDRFENLHGRRGARTNRSQQVARNLEAYAENRLYLQPALALVTGLQYAHAEREYRDKFFASPAQNESFEATYVQANPKLGLLYDYSPAVQIYANISRSFEPPSFAELAGGLQPNIVDAQKATTLEVGSRGYSEHVDWDISLYYARLQDELLQTQVLIAGNNPNPAAQTTNASRTVHAGLEFGMTARLPAGFEWRHSLLVNEFRFDDDDDFGDNRLAGVPPLFMRGELLYRNRGFYIGPTFEASRRYAVDFAETLYAGSYAIIGLKMGQQINEQLSWFVEARNLADRKYVATSGVVRDQKGLDGALFLPGDGRALYAGLQWRP
jgi:iron complex outermembrane receptor protein